jgi:hypothetical protein
MKFIKCLNGYTHPEKEGIKENQKCSECKEKECMFRDGD